ncbi:hypothetical protein [Burkholderia cepacia]|uniref:hypothetical protein n=1 Tax=Burkholderia cepacia TaxID=292 RepID=UPI0015893742|nr:hypothetical protein [Burkholderia cepacia]MDN7901541.1 hypothetical protein [Burkholderia cepacia]
MSNPSVPTIKRLFAVSRNECAFPKCKTPLVDSPSGKVTGRISHIKARQPGGPRYDASQTEDERHGFENLVLLCPIHHDVIDDDPGSYTVERLIKIKADHESSHAPIAEPSDSVAQSLVVNINNNSITHGSIVYAPNQMGGQAAHSITNIGPQPRKISTAAANALVAELRRNSPEEINLMCIMGDGEGFQLANQLKNILEAAGWSVDGVNQGILRNALNGVAIETPAARPGLNALLNWCDSVGLKPVGNLNPNSQTVQLIVGSNL